MVVIVLTHLGIYIPTFQSRLHVITSKTGLGSLGRREREGGLIYLRSV